MIKVKILLVADKEDSYIWDYFDAEKFKDIELIISCGDLKASYLEYLTTMIKAPLFYVPGNHDGKYLEKPPEGCTSIDGKFIVYKNIRILGLGGSIDYNNGPFQYSPKQMERRISKLKLSLWKNGGFDILVSHSPAKGLGDGEDYCHTGFEAFIKLIDKYSPRYFFHGHQHLNYKKTERIITYNNTTIVNGYGYYIIDTMVL